MPHLDQEKLSCSICLDLLKDPVTLPCGHSYCMICIKNHWDGEDLKGVHTCPQCRKTFVPRPVLGKNTMLAELVEELKNAVYQTAPQDNHTYAGPGDVPCDFCTGRKQKATKSCLQCLASYCDVHLQPHYDSPTFQKHKLVEASANLQENICSLHNRVKEVFCRSDQQCICYLCSMNEHKDHDTVPAAAERAERQNELDPCREKIQQRIQDLEKYLKVFHQQVEDISSSADEAVRNSQTMFSQLVQLIEKRSSEVEQQIRSQQEGEMQRTKELEEELEQEIAELKRKDSELKKLSYTEDHGQFLLCFHSLSEINESAHSSVSIQPLSCFEMMTASVSELTEKLQDILCPDCAKTSPTEGGVRPAEYLRPAEHRSLVKQAKLEPPPQQPPSFVPPAEPKTTVCQQPRVAPQPPSATPSFRPSADPKTTVCQLPRVAPPPPHATPSYNKSAARRNSMKQQPRVVPQAEPKSFLKQQPRLAPPPPSSSAPPAEPKGLVPQQPVLIPPPVSFQTPAEPKCRGELLQYACQITLDPNTVSKWLSISDGNRKVTYMKKEQSYSDHPERFTDSLQVLSKESLVGRCYWEVKWSRFVSVAVTYKSVSRTGSESGFGFNDKSWALWCHNNEFIHDGNSTCLSVPQSSKIGVFLDHSAGTVSFYSVSDTLLLLHKVQTTFTEPLHAGLWVCSGSAKLVQLL